MKHLHINTIIKKVGSLFAIGIVLFSMATVFMQPKTVYAQNVQGFSQPSSIVCDLTPLNGVDFSMSACIAEFIFSFPYTFSAWLLSQSGRFFDWGLSYTLNPEMYKSSFILEGWKIIRDLCNIVFIFMLVYIAFLLVLNVNSQDPKKMIVWVILMALLVNFSLFAGRLVIDFGNATAQVFYNQINVTTTTAPNNAGVSKKEVTAKIVEQLAPQKLVGEDVFNKINNLTGNSNFSTNSLYIVLFSMGTIMNSIAIYGFVLVGLLLFGRIIALWLLMIAAPFAFASFAIPNARNTPFIGWSSWWKEVVNQSIVGTVFIFFLYLMVLFIERNQNSTFLATLASNGSADFGELIVEMFMKFLFYIGLLIAGVKAAKALSGQVGQFVGNVVGKVQGTVMGVAGTVAGGAAVLAGGAIAGGAGLAGRQVAGRIGAKVAQSDWLNDKINKKGAGGYFARMGMRTAQAAATSSFDVRNIPTTAGKLKTRIFGEGDKGAGGYLGQVDKNAKNKVERAETLLGISALRGQNANDQDKKASDWQKLYEAERDNQMKLQGDNFDEVKFRKDYEAGKHSLATQTATDMGLAGQNSTARVKTAEEINDDRKRDKIDRMEFGENYVAQRNAAKARVEEDLKANPNNPTVNAKDGYNAKTKSFDEALFREQNKIETKRNFAGDNKALIDAVETLRNSLKPEKSFTPAQRGRMEGALNVSNTKLRSVENILTQIKDKFNLTNINDVNETHIQNIITDWKTTGVPNTIHNYQSPGGPRGLGQLESEYRNALDTNGTGYNPALAAQLRSDIDAVKGILRRTENVFDEKDRLESKREGLRNDLFTPPPKKKN